MIPARPLALGLLALALASPASAAAPAPAAAKPKTGDPLVLQVSPPRGEEWFAIYVQGKKAGYGFSETRRATYAGKPAVLERGELTLRVVVGTNEVTRSISEERTYESKDGGRLLAFRMELKGDGGQDLFLGLCSEKGIELVRRRPGKADERRTLPPTRETVENIDPVHLVARSGKKWEGYKLDVQQEFLEKSTVTSPMGPGVFVAAGVSIPVLRFKTLDEREDLPTVTTLGPDGRVLETRVGDGTIVRPEPKEQAMKLERLDLFDLTRVVMPERLPPAIREPPAEIRWRVGGVPAEFYKETYRQSWTPLAKGEAQLVVRARNPGSRTSRPVTGATDPQVLEALKPTVNVESDAPAIAALARQLAGDEKDAWTVARRINAWVAKSLEKTYGSSADRATDVLAQKKGDCTEHSLLSTSLLRAAGIPARRLDGVVYIVGEDGVPAFYWHQWVEAWVGEWVAMDPTLGEAVADPTHIAFGGEGRSDTVGLMGQLKIKAEQISAGPGAAALSP